MNQTSILAETLAGIQEIREGIEKNAKHVLTSTLKEDLEAIVRKGLNEMEDENSNDMLGDSNPTDLDSMGADSEEMTTDLDIDPTAGVDGEPEVIDLTDAPDDEVIQKFDLMKPTDEIEIVQTPSGGIQINIEPKGEESGETLDLPTEPEMGDEISSEENPEMGSEENPEMDSDELKGDEEDETIKEENKEVVYEIEVVNDEIPENPEDYTKQPGYIHEEEAEEEKHMKNKEIEEDVTHVIAKSKMKHTDPRTKELQESLVVTRKKLHTLMAENKNKSEELAKVNSLVNDFKLVENEYKTAIGKLKNQLQEVALFTSNLTYAVKLMTENSTTKDEKLDILKRFDSAKTLTESREIFNSMESLFTASKVTPEKTLEERVLSTNKTSGSTKLNESTAYKNPQLERMLDIIGKIK
jgi:hypothetical protein